MIPGDIDLTENLDFRKTVKKELPKIPSNWSGHNNINVCKCNFSITTNTYLNTTTESIIGYIDSSSIIRWNYGNEYSTDSDSIIYYYTQYNNTTTSISPSIRISIKDEPIKRVDVFGNEIRKEKPIDKICWRLSKCNYNEYINRIAWKRYTYSHGLYERYDDPIPWEINDRYKRNKKGSISNKICYLKDKSDRFISEYLNKDKQDLSSYLTNMQWIRVHDALIE